MTPLISTIESIHLCRFGGLTERNTPRSSPFFLVCVARLPGERSEGEGDHAHSREGQGLRRGRGHQAPELRVRPARLRCKVQRRRGAPENSEGLSLQQGRYVVIPRLVL